MLLARGAWNHPARALEPEAREGGEAPDPAQITVIVPVAPGDDAACQRLKARLHALAPAMAVAASSEGGRARSLNAGARRANTPYLWFLHADSLVEAEHLAALCRALKEAPDAVHFFDLAFITDGPAPVRLNAWAANRRARWLGLPFGDQGLATARSVWERLGGFPEDVAYGEDHVFIWRAHLAGVPVRRIPLALPTSARAYREQGWLRLTARRQMLWLRQAAPFAWRLVRERFGRGGRRGE